jgi:hypothetical protein
VGGGGLEHHFTSHSTWEHSYCTHPFFFIYLRLLILGRRAWISSQNAKAVVERGFSLVHAPSDYFCVNYKSGQRTGDTPGATN